MPLLTFHLCGIPLQRGALKRKDLRNGGQSVSINHEAVEGSRRKWCGDGTGSEKRRTSCACDLNMTKAFQSLKLLVQRIIWDKGLGVPRSSWLILSLQIPIMQW